jgi:putative oxidoreductase
MGIIGLIGRIILGAILAMSGINHFRQMKGMVAYTRSKRVPMPSLAVAVTGIMLLFSGVAIIGWWGSVIIPALVILAIFLFFATFMMHQFWKVTDPQARRHEMVAFTGNMMLFGATLVMLAFVSN